MLRLSFGLSPVALLIIVLIPVFAAAQQDIDAGRLKMAARIRNLVESIDSYAAIEQIQKEGDAVEIAQRYEFLVRDLYWQEKAMHAVLPIANAGILYCMTKFREVFEEDSASAHKFLEFAKIMSFNLSSFTWPAWEEKGIELTEHALLAGLDAAKLNWRLVTMLGGDHDQLSNSYWAIGAQLLALKEYNNAALMFRSAAEEAQKATSKEAELMNNGYIAMAQVLAGITERKAQADFDKIVQELRDLGTDDAKYFADQLVSVLEFFSR